MTEWFIEECELERVQPLRSAISHAGAKPPAACLLPLDDESARHWVAVWRGEDVGAGTLHRDPAVVAGQWAPFRLRALCVREDLRDSGIGSGLVVVRLDAVRLAGESFAWASARTCAVGLYESLGAVRDSRVYLRPNTGEHCDVLYGPL